MVKHFGKILICLLLSVAVLTLTGCGVMDGARLLEQDEVYVTPSPSPVPEPKGIGESWISDIWEIRLTSAETVDSVGAEPYDEKASYGKKLLVLYFDVTNVTEDSAYFNYIYFKASVDGETAIQRIVSAKTLEGRTVAIGSVASEETARYYIIYEVPENWQTFEIYYDIGGMHSDKLADFKFTNDL